MTRDQIDEMPVGPELDALACAAVGWEAKSRTCYCDGQWCRTPEYYDAKVWPKISTDIATAMEALATETIQCYRITKVGTAGFSVVLEIPEATSKNLTLAIARALAKLTTCRK